MIPFKTIEGNEGAVLLAGLPIVYTSTVHGMAYDITGQGIADESGMRNALYLAIDVYNNRQMNAELAQNPLRHYDIASNKMCIRDSLCFEPYKPLSSADRLPEGFLKFAGIALFQELPGQIR